MFASLDLKKLFTDFQKQKVLIIGDVMIDSYLWGKVKRISPEAPVPVVSDIVEEQRLGGAANVALNIKAMGAVPILCSVVGKDRQGTKIPGSPGRTKSFRCRNNYRQAKGNYSENQGDKW